MNNSFSIILIACALAMDAFAISISSGIIIKKVQIQHAFLIASFFGIFQAFMPVLGWLGGKWADQLMQRFDHWIAFGLLFFIGIKMIRGAKKNEPVFNPLKLSILFLLAVSTSIDAFAVGMTLSFLEVKIIAPIIVIGMVTFVLSFAGVYIGSIFGHIFEKKLEIIGGCILIGIGIRILIEHLFFQN